MKKINCDFKSLHFENKNSGDLRIFPQFILIENDSDFALIDLLQIKIEYNSISFIEEDRLPNDAQVIGQTWAKSNKDGSRDKRFSQNYEIPVVQYSGLHIQSNSGVNEYYMFSNQGAALDFAEMFDEYKEVLINSIA